MATLAGIKAKAEAVQAWIWNGKIDIDPSAYDTDEMFHSIVRDVLRLAPQPGEPAVATGSLAA